MEWKLKHFKDITTEELYYILALRSEVFVVEQNCVYQDLDFNDQQAFHLLGMEEGQLVAYSRLFVKNVVSEHASIGRVIVKKTKRGQEYGQLLMRESIERMEGLFDEETIIIHAQAYLRKFYESFGFIAITDMYDMDGIPHLDMIRKKGGRE